MLVFYPGDCHTPALTRDVQYEPFCLDFMLMCFAMCSFVSELVARFFGAFCDLLLRFGSVKLSNSVLIRLSVTPTLCWHSSIKGDLVFRRCSCGLKTQSWTVMTRNECRAMAGAKHSGVNPLRANIRANFSLAQRSQLELGLMFPYEVKSDREWSKMVHYRFDFHIRSSKLVFTCCSASA